MHPHVLMDPLPIPTQAKVLMDPLPIPTQAVKHLASLISEIIKSIINMPKGQAIALNNHCMQQFRQ